MRHIGHIIKSEISGCGCGMDGHFTTLIVLHMVMDHTFLNNSPLGVHEPNRVWVVLLLLVLRGTPAGLVLYTEGFDPLWAPLWKGHFKDRERRREREKERKRERESPIEEYCMSQQLATDTPCYACPAPACADVLACSSSDASSSGT